MNHARRDLCGGHPLVGELNKHLQMRPGLKNELIAAGITEADFLRFWENDPLATDSTQLGTGRFATTSTMYPYEAPATANDPAIPTQTTISSSVNFYGRIVVSKHVQGRNVFAGSTGFLDIARLTVKDSASWEWTNSSSSSTSTGTTQSASCC